VATENETAQIIVDAAIEVHRLLGGPGLLESVYEEALALELQLRGCRVERQNVIPLKCSPIYVSVTKDWEW
jgi:GxxExxY protein